jgi:hypothetical protein
MSHLEEWLRSLVPLHWSPYKVVHRIVDETAKMPHTRPQGSTRDAFTRALETRDVKSDPDAQPSKMACHRS